MGLSVIILPLLISKPIALGSFFSFQLRVKTSFRKNIMDDSVFIFTEVNCKRNPQITYMEESEETEKLYRVIRLWKLLGWSTLLHAHNSSNLCLHTVTAVGICSNIALSPEHHSTCSTSKGWNHTVRPRSYLNFHADPWANSVSLPMKKSWLHPCI